MYRYTYAQTISIVKKRHEQVEKTLEMKKWSRNGSIVMKQGRNVYDVVAIYNGFISLTVVYLL